MSGKVIVLAALAYVAFGTAAHAGDRFFRFDPGLEDRLRQQQHHYEPPPPPSPPLTAFDRNMAPGTNVKPSSDDYDLSERISFDGPATKRSHHQAKTH